MTVHVTPRICGGNLFYITVYARLPSKSVGATFMAWQDVAHCVLVLHTANSLKWNLASDNDVQRSSATRTNLMSKAATTTTTVIFH